MRICWVYVLDLVEVDNLYVGSTTNLLRRVKEHKGGWEGSRLTGRYTFNSVIACYPCTSLEDARLLEGFIKYCRINVVGFKLPPSEGIEDTEWLVSLAKAHPEKRIKELTRWQRDALRFL